MLEARDLRIDRGDRLLFSGLALCAAEGTVTHLTGHNGSGKTTLMRTLAGLVTPDEGTVLWCGQPLAASTSFRRELNYIGHQAGLNGELSGRENLDFFRTVLDRGGDVEAALDRLDARGFAERPVRLLSAGQRQRLSLARLVLFEATLWMLDEPFTALDSTVRSLIEALLDEHAANGGIVLIATHQAFTLRRPIAVVSLDARR